MFCFRHVIFHIGIGLMVGSTFSTPPPAASNSKLKQAEDSLLVLLSSIISTESFDEKLEINQKFQQLFHRVLSIPSSMEYPFTGLKNVGILPSTNKRVRVITWNIPQAGGSQVYSGFIQVRLGKGVELFTLSDSRDQISNPQMEILTPGGWYGALYYQMVEKKYHGRELYTLLGVEMNNIFSTRRVVECLWIDEKGQPIFGAPAFKIKNQVINRVIFEYSARASMVLRFEPKNGMIVFDHLSPMRPEYVGNYQFYGPDFSYDAFRFEKGQWEYLADIDVRNPKRNKPAAPVAPPEKNPEPGFLYTPNHFKK